MEVAGPAWISVSPVLGQGFRFELEGPEVLAGSHALLRLRDTGGACGFVPFRDDEEKSSFSLLEAKEEHEILILSTPPNQGATLNISGVMGSQMLVAYLYRHLVYSICWCARNCFKDGVSEIDEEAFSANVGEFFPRGPDTEGFTPQYVVAGVSFDLMVRGDRLTMKATSPPPTPWPFAATCAGVATAPASRRRGMGRPRGCKTWANWWESQAFPSCKRCGRLFRLIHQAPIAFVGASTTVGTQ